MKEFKIFTKGGTMCFYGQWFGRPYDNFHRIRDAVLDDGQLKVRFQGGEILTVINPQKISNGGKSFVVEKADEVIWQYAPYGLGNGQKERSIIYRKNTDGTITKIVSGKERIINPEENIAVQCRTY